MTKICFMGAGSTVFAKNILGDSMLAEPLRDAHIALYDIDSTRLAESHKILDVLNRNINQGRATITSHLDVKNRREALRHANFVVNAIQVGGYEPSTVIDFEIPKKYGLRQTIADTLGIGGIFRALRTIPVVLDFARDMQAVCPNAWFLNYVNPMAMITGALLQGSGIRGVGLCHSVQTCASVLLWEVGLLPDVRKLNWKVAGINHQAWLLEIKDGNRDLYPTIKQIAAKMVADIRRKGGRKLVEAVRAKAIADGMKPWRDKPEMRIAMDMVRLEIMRHFGYYVTESSEHSAEYMPYWIKRTHPELIDEFNIPLDEYPRRCVEQIKGWKRLSGELINDPNLSHKRTHEYGSYIMEAITTGQPIRIHGNVMNTDLITNLPRRACVEVPCLVDSNGVQGCHVGDLPEQCAAMNRTNINVQILTIDAALKRRKDLVYQAAMMDPHTAAELTLDQIRNLCDDLFKAHGKMIPAMK